MRAVKSSRRTRIKRMKDNKMDFKTKKKMEKRRKSK